MNSIQERYETSRCSQEDVRIKKVVGLIGKAGAVLDLGCLDGTVGELFIKQGNIVHGIDASKSAIPRAVSRGLHAKLGNLRLCQCEVRHLPS